MGFIVLSVTFLFIFISLLLERTKSAPANKQNDTSLGCVPFFLKREGTSEVTEQKGQNDGFILSVSRPYILFLKLSMN